MAESDENTVWVLQGSRIGDNAQARALAHLLGWRTVLKQLCFTQLHNLPNLILGAGLATIDRARSDPLVPPWPRLVIGVGRRSVPVALWIKRQSGGKARLVLLGRPRAPLAWFDLVITTPQYGLPNDPNVLEVPLPLARPEAPLPAELEMWRARFSALPRPWTGVLVGGSRFPLRLGREGAARLGQVLSNRPGSSLISTSPRTSDAEARALAASLTAPHYLYRWAPGPDNPHRSILALADRLVVTGDSVSMLAEGWATGRPVERFPLQRAPFGLSWPAKAGLGAWLARHGIVSSPRDPDLVTVPIEPPDDERIVERIKALIVKP